MAQLAGMSSTGAVERRRRTPRRSALRRAVRLAAFALLAILFVPVALLPVYAIVNPPFGTVMLWKALAGASIDKDWTPLERISPHLIRAVLSAEDARFCAHDGIDFVELQNALEDGDGRLRGASTLTMQTVKNLFLWSNRDYVRKGLEAPLAFYADLVLSKRRIMEIYLNIAEWGDGVYGAEAAARRHFNVSAADLSASRAALLAAVLPSPLTRDAGHPSEAVRRAARRIAARAEQSGAYVGCVLG
jgi:monofunctional biosynthetic peptidoglycan transglycosylase